MPDDWFVRVQEAEYGPVDLETLLEWKAEGRLIPTNEVREASDTDWTIAGTIPALFPPPLISQAQRELEVTRRRTFREIIGETFRIYARGFPQFFALGLMISVPSLGLKLSWAFITFSETEPLAGNERIAAAIAIVMLAAVLTMWPIFVAGL